MKKILSLILVLCLLLCGCGTLIPARSTMPTDAPQTQPSTVPDAASEPASTEPEPTEEETEPETEPEPVILRNPLNGTILEQPYTGRIFSISINNLEASLPHVNLVNADLVFETFVNGSIIRCLGLFTDLSGLDAIGSVRSDRVMWNEISQLYDTVMVHAGGSSHVLNQANELGMDHFNIDSWRLLDITSFRDEERQKSGYDYEHTLFAKGPGLLDYCEQEGIRTTQSPDKDYNLRFTEDGTPADGLPAKDISITITMQKYKKDTLMAYDSDLHKYVFNEYDKALVDGITGEPEAFTNVLILETQLDFDWIYQAADFTQGGEGWFACGGKAQRIRWGTDSTTSPLWLTTEDGDPLYLGVGNTYIAITEPGSAIEGIG